MPIRLNELIDLCPPGCRVGTKVPSNTVLRGLHSDSRRIQPGDVFAALPGTRSQGIDYVRSAFEAGAVTALIPQDADVAADLAEHCIRVDAIRGTTARAAAAVYGHPAERLLTVGVTGTNGKTSTCHILKHLLEAAGHRVVMLTTVAHEFEAWRVETPNTTPDAPVIQAALANALAKGATAAVLEVSAHGVLLQRIDACRFDGLVFTNLAEDHQDFFDGLEPYFAVKRRLFVESHYHKPGCVAVIGVDDPFGRRLSGDCVLPLLRVGQSAPVDVSLEGLTVSATGLTGRLAIGRSTFTVDTTLASSFNRGNLAMASAMASLLNVPDAAIARGLVRPIRVPGRLTRVPSSAPFQVIVDFAHTESALGNLLRGLRGECRGRLIVVFGAGGDKDPLRRRSLPRVVIELAEVGVITLDNPRSEPPQTIIDTMVVNWQALAGECGRPPALIVEPDRRLAIARALGCAGPGDIVVLAGKGHETTQIFADRIEVHDDHAVASAWLDAAYGVALSESMTCTVDTRL